MESIIGNIISVRVLNNDKKWMIQVDEKKQHLTIGFNIINRWFKGFWQGARIVGTCVGNEMKEVTKLGIPDSPKHLKAWLTSLMKELQRKERYNDSTVKEIQKILIKVTSQKEIKCENLHILCNECMRTYETEEKDGRIYHMEEDSIADVFETLEKNIESVLKAYESLHIYKDLCDKVIYFRATTEKNDEKKQVEVLSESVISKFALSIKSYKTFLSDPYVEFNHELTYLDAFALIFGIKLNDICKGICSYFLNRAMKDVGHTCMILKEIADAFKMQSIFKKKVSEADFARYINSFTNIVFTITDLGEEGIAPLGVVAPPPPEYVYLRYVYEQEESIAKNVRRMLNESVHVYDTDDIEMLINEYEKKQSKSLHKKQKKAILNLFTTTNIEIITGFPGTGKSCVTDCIEYCYINLNPRHSDPNDCAKNGVYHDSSKCNIAWGVLHNPRSDEEAVVQRCAPTGKAARRIQGKTIHKLLKVIPDEDHHGRTTFKYTRFNPLLCHLLIIDEASMIDTELGSCLFSAINAGSKVVILGDTDQLPSIGAGKILMSLVKSHRIPRVHLTECFRNGGNIQKLCTDVLNKESECLDNLDGDGIEFIWIDDNKREEDGILEIVKNVYMKNKETVLDEITDIQILCPSKKSVIKLNKLIKGDVGSFQKGEKAMCTKNSKDNIVFNGDIGRIIDIYDNRCDLLIDQNKIIKSYLLLI